MPTKKIQQLGSEKFMPDGQGVIKLPPISGIIPVSMLGQYPMTKTMQNISLTRQDVCKTDSSAIKSSQQFPSKFAANSLSTKMNIVAATQNAKTGIVQAPVTCSKTRYEEMHNSASGPLSNERCYAFISHSLDTFLSQEPSIDNVSLARRKRRRTSKHVLVILQQEFEHCKAPFKERRIKLANICNMTERAVQIWFQNRRQSIKKKKRDSSDYPPSTLITPASVLKAGSHLDKSSYKESVQREKITSFDNTGGLPIASATSHQLDNKKYTSKLSQLIPSGQPARGQVFTFRLRSDKQLTPIYTSPNNRVNKLINGSIKDFDGVNSRSKGDCAKSVSFLKKPKGLNKFTSSPLKELSVKTIKK